MITIYHQSLEYLDGNASQKEFVCFNSDLSVKTTVKAVDWHEAERIATEKCGEEMFEENHL